MSRLKEYIARNSTMILLVLIGLLIGSSMVMLAAQGADTRKLASTTADLTTNTNKIVRSQTDILNAIKTVTNDTRLTAEQQTSIIICMLQVPIAERTTNTEENCRRQAQEVSVTAIPGTSGSTAQGTSSSSSNPVVSSTQDTTTVSPTQPNNSQPDQEDPPLLNCKLDLLGLHLGCN